jgi:hypothetical protein
MDEAESNAASVNPGRRKCFVCGCSVIIGMTEDPKGNEALRVAI